MVTHVGVPPNSATLPRRRMIRREIPAARAPDAPAGPAVAVVSPHAAPLASGQTAAIPTFPQKRWVAAVANRPDAAPTSAPTGAISPIRLPVHQVPPSRRPTTRGPARRNDAERALTNGAMSAEVLAAKPATAGPHEETELTVVAKVAPRAINMAAPVAARPRPTGQDPLSAQAARPRKKRSPHAQAHVIVVPAPQTIVRRKRASAYRRCFRVPA